MEERLRSYLGDAENLTPNKRGWETTIYAFDQGGLPQILRLYQGNMVDFRAAAEYRMLHHLEQVGYPVPRVYRYEPDPEPLGGPFLIMERIEGPTMSSLLSQETTPQLVEQLCALMLQLHRLDWQQVIGPTGIWADREQARGPYDPIRFSEMLLRELSLDAPFQPLVSWLAEQGRDIVLQSAIVHGDLHPENILVRPDGRPAVIDWGATRIGDPRVDVASSYVLMATQWSGSLGERFRETYARMAGDLPDFDYFVTWALIQRLMVMVTVLCRGSASIGLRPGMEAQLWQQIGYVRQIAGHVAERTGLDLAAINALLDVEPA